MWGPILPRRFSTFFEQLKQLNPFLTIIASSPSGSVRKIYNYINIDIPDWFCFTKRPILYGDLLGQLFCSGCSWFIGFWDRNHLHHSCFYDPKNSLPPMFATTISSRWYLSCFQISSTNYLLFPLVSQSFGWEATYLMDLYQSESFCFQTFSLSIPIW